MVGFQQHKAIQERRVGFGGYLLFVDWCVLLFQGVGLLCHYFEQLDFFKTATVSNHIQKESADDRDYRRKDELYLGSS